MIIMGVNSNWNGIICVNRFSPWVLASRQFCVIVLLTQQAALSESGGVILRA